MLGYDRARSAVLRSTSRLRAWIDFRRSGAPPAAELRPLLARWGIERFTVVNTVRGASNTGVCVDTDDGRYLLRRLTTGRAHVLHMIRLIGHLAATDFPYEVPVFLATTAGEHYFADGATHWGMYRFIEGTRAAPFATASRARNVGALVGNYHRAVATLDLQPVRGQFHLPLFESETVVRSLSEARSWFATQRDVPDIGTAVVAEAPTVVAMVRALSPAAIASVAALPTTTAYYDWHRFNMIDRAGKIVGLIDFDSIVEAPRIVDVQNALTYVLLGTRTPDLRLAGAFLEAYSRLVELSRLEASLIMPVFVDRVAWLVANIVDEVRRNGTSTRERVGRRLITLLSWLRVHEDECVKLFDATA